jgi:hypothetical protein
MPNSSWMRRSQPLNSYSNKVRRLIERLLLRIKWWVSTFLTWERITRKSLKLCTHSSEMLVTQQHSWLNTKLWKNSRFKCKNKSRRWKINMQRAWQNFKRSWSKNTYLRLKVRKIDLVKCRDRTKLRRLRLYNCNILIKKWVYL